MVVDRPKTYNYHAVVDKDNNIIYKCPSKQRAVSYAKSHSYAVAVKEIEHIFKEKTIWLK